MEKYIVDERTGLKYELVGDYYLLVGEDEPLREPLGIWGQRHRRFLREHKRCIYDGQWRKKVRQFQIPIFGENTDATWLLRFDDIIANALTLGPLREMEATLTKAQREKLRPYLHGKVRPEHLEILIAYYEANKPEDSDWGVLPVTAFNNYFCSTVFSRQVLKAVTGTVTERSDMSYGSGRYRVQEEFL